MEFCIWSVRSQSVNMLCTFCNVSKKVSVEVFLRLSDPVTQASGSLFNTRTLTSLKMHKEEKHM